MSPRAIRVLLVDESPAVRECQRILTGDPGIEVVGSAPDPYVARDLILSLQPDVLLLDVELPRVDGITFLRRLMRYHPLPTVVLSSLTPEGSERAQAALAAGAVAVLCKPAADRLSDVGPELIAAVKLAARTSVRRAESSLPGAGAAPPALHRVSQQILAIGASTGGTTAIETVLLGMPANGPGTVVVQHMPPVFTRSFAERLDRLCAMQVREAADGDGVAPGLVLVAPGGKHLVLRRRDAGYMVEVNDGPPVNGHRPSVDVLFHSVAEAAGPNALGVLLTGMGGDGARGLLGMRQAGAFTLAQDEASCVVWGMPRVAVEVGAAEQVLPLNRICGRLLEVIRARGARPDTLPRR